MSAYPPLQFLNRIQKHCPASSNIVCQLLKSTNKVERKSALDCIDRKTLVVSFMNDEEKLEGMWHQNAYIKDITNDYKSLT